MNNKGFTLVELLAVLVVLAILIAIAVPSTISISNKIKVNMYCNKIESIETAAKLYGEDRKDSFSEKYEDAYASETINVERLVETGDLKKDSTTAPYILDPRDNASMDELQIIVYVKYNRIYVHFPDEVTTTCDK